MARRVQGRAESAVEFRLLRADDRGRPAGQRGLARRQEDSVGFEETDGDECAGGESFSAHGVSDGVESVTTSKPAGVILAWIKCITHPLQGWHGAEDAPR